MGGNNNANSQPSWARKLAAWVGGVSLVVAAVTGLLIAIGKMESAASPFVHTAVKSLFVGYGLAEAPSSFSTAPVTINWASGPGCYSPKYDAPLGYIILDAIPTTEHIANNVPVPPNAPISQPDRKHTEAGWCAQDPGGGRTSSSADVSIRGHIEPETLKITALGWAIFIGSTILGIVFVYLWRRPAR
jgi:hypothetical protein